MDVLSFVAVASVVILAPGPDMALVGRNALLGGRRAALGTAVGVAAGLAVWSIAAGAGVAALLQRSEPAFTALRLVGAAYLVWLGAHALLCAWRGAGPAPLRGHATGQLGLPRSALRQGLLSNLSNPKIAVFFTSFLPQFAGAGGGFAPLVLLGVVFCLMTLAWLTVYALVVARVGAVLRGPWLRRTIESVSGAFLIGFGLRLASESR